MRFDGLYMAQVVIGYSRKAIKCPIMVPPRTTRGELMKMNCTGYFDVIGLCCGVILSQIVTSVYSGTHWYTLE